jgi:hypothetical protein
LEGGGINDIRVRWGRRYSSTLAFALIIVDVTSIIVGRVTDESGRWTDVGRFVASHSVRVGRWGGIIVDVRVGNRKV